MDRLTAYRNFITSYGLLHLQPDDSRLIWADAREIAGLRVGIAGLNSAWSCADKNDKAQMWCATEWQVSELQRRMGPVDFSFALIHHPSNWLTHREDPSSLRFLRQTFPVLLHGHEHAEWVAIDNEGRLIVSAGACYQCSWMSNGYGIGHIDRDNLNGWIRLRQWDPAGRGWVAHNVAGKTKDGVWPLTGLSWLANSSLNSRAHEAAPTFDDQPITSGQSTAVHYTRRYCQHVIDQHDVLELFGCDIPRELQRHQLSVAYVSLNLSPDADNDDDEPVSTNSDKDEQGALSPKSKDDSRPTPRRDVNIKSNAVEVVLFPWL